MLSALKHHTLPVTSHTPNQVRGDPGSTLTWHCEVLSVYDLILSVVELVVVLLCVAVQVLQIGHHRHAPPRIPALCAGRDGHGRLRRRMFLTHPAGENRCEDHSKSYKPRAVHWWLHVRQEINNKSLACVALFSVWKTSLQGRTRAFLHGNEINTVERPQQCHIKLKKKKADNCWKTGLNMETFVRGVQLLEDNEDFVC